MESYIFCDEDGSNENAEDGADGSTDVVNAEVEMADAEVGAEEALNDEISGPPKEAPALGAENATPAAEAIESKDFAK